MSARKTPRAARGSSFLSSYSEPRLQKIFEGVRRFVSGKFPTLKQVTLYFDCPEIIEFRRRNQGYLGERALMHAAHRSWKICVFRWAAGLSDTILVALYLHEFGHFGGNSTEPAANEWVRKNFGITIEYRGPLDLQWIDPKIARQVLARHSSSLSLPS